MRKKLSIFQIVTVICCSIMTMVDGMFIWTVYKMFNNISKQNMSLYNLMTVQRVDGGPFMYWIFNIALVSLLICCVLRFFIDNNFLKIKWVELTSAIVSFVSGITMIIMSCNYSTSFKYNGETRYTAVSMGILAYVEIILLITLVLVELYKQFKCDE